MIHQFIQYIKERFPILPLFIFTSLTSFGVKTEFVGNTDWYKSCIISFMYLLFLFHLRVLDVATEELLWSGTYLLGARAEFFSFKTQQQKLKQGFKRLVQRFIRETYQHSS